MDASIVVRLINETQAGFNKIQGDLSSLDRSAKNVEKTFGQVQTALAGMLGLLAGNAVIKFIDDMQTLDNRLRLVTKNQDELNTRFKELFDVAQRTRAPIGETVDLYSKLAQNQQIIGKTGSEVTKVVEAFNMAMAISGTSGAAAAGAITQFAQAMQSGKLQGDEFRSLAEAVPKVLQILSEKTGIAREDLKELASKGFLNAKIVAQALAEALPDLQKEFDNTSVTVRQAITQMTNEFQRLAKDFLDTSGTSQALVNAINHITANMENLIPIMKVVGVALLGLAAFFAPIATAVAAATVAVIAFADVIGPVLKPVVAAAEDALGGLIKHVGAFVAAIKAAINLENPFDAYAKSVSEYEAKAKSATSANTKLAGSTGDVADQAKKATGPSAEMKKLMEENGLAAAMAGLKFSEFTQKLKLQTEQAGLDSEQKRYQQLMYEGLKAKAEDLKKPIDKLTEAEKAQVEQVVKGAVAIIDAKEREAKVREDTYKQAVALLDRFADDSRKNQNQILTETQKFDRDLMDVEIAYQNAMLNSKGKTAEELKKIEQDYRDAVKGLQMRGLNDLAADYKKYTDSTKTEAERFNEELKRLDEARQRAGIEGEQIYQDALAGLRAKYAQKYIDEAKQFRESELDSNQKYYKRREELDRLYYEQGVIDNDTYLSLIRKAEKDYRESTVREYSALYGLLTEKLQSFTGLTQKEYGIVKDVIKLTFGVDVEDLIKQFFASSIRYLLGFRTATTDNMNGIGGIIQGLFGSGGSAEGNVSTFVASGTGLMNTFVDSSGGILGGLLGVFSKVFGGGLDIIGGFIKSALNLFGGFGDSVSSLLGSIFSGGGGGGGFWDSLLDIGGSILSGGGDILGSIGSGIGSIAGSIGDALGITDLFSGIGNVFSGGAGGGISSALGSLGSVASSVGLVGAGMGLIDAFGSGLSKVLGIDLSSIGGVYRVGETAKANTAAINAAEAGTAQYRQLALGNVTSEQKAGFAYQNALGRISTGTGGYLDYAVTGKPYPRSLSQFYVNGLPPKSVLEKDWNAQYGAQFGSIPPQWKGVYYAALGGVINRRSLMMTGSGPVVAGEAGPEAILPLSRGPNGELGVNTNGQAVNITFNINAMDAKDFDTLLIEKKQLITNIVSNAVRQGRSFA